MEQLVPLNASPKKHRINTTDVVLALGFALFTLLASNATGQGGVSPTMRVVLGLWLILPLAFRRTLPELCFYIITLAMFVQQFLGTSLLLPADFAFLVALYTVVSFGSKQNSRFALYVSISVALWMGVTHGNLIEDPGMGLGLALFCFVPIMLATWSVAGYFRSRTETLSALQAHNTRLEQEQKQLETMATTAERNRIAREMHDIVAHSLSVMIAQADGGRYIAEQDAKKAQETFDTIAETGRATLGDMRRLLGVLRPNVKNVDRSITHSPQPDQNDIEPLVSQMRASGMDVSYVKLGQARNLPPGTSLIIYRICQESLTNVLKHAGPQPQVTVLFSWHSDHVTLKVDDDGRGASAISDNEGQGLIGMKERAAIFGGTLTAGPRPGGGFRVLLELPIPSAKEQLDDHQ